jgi:DMSO/TMAO reductase YedYZ molybdopterin-dependent catalytic subunit
MTRFGEKLGRRDLLGASLVGAGLWLCGFDKLAALQTGALRGTGPFAGGKFLELCPFVGESPVPVSTVLGTGLDARRYSDLSEVSRERPGTPPEDFYLRTAASDLLPSGPWMIGLGGPRQPIHLGMEELRGAAKPMGLHLLECSGNTRATRFSLISVADWTGVPVVELLEAKTRLPKDRVTVSGFDQYPAPSMSSEAGAEWVFALDELKASKAFLATEMNGKPLSRDHGAPVRLVVPGWYGCASIKWVNAVSFADENAAATTQMREFASRTHQRGVPELARAYRPATIDQAAMPTRVEKWLVDGKITYRVAGILWGGRRLIEALEIRFNPEEDYVRVDDFRQTANDPWSFWSHHWTPRATGSYIIRLRVPDRAVETKRLDSGHYVRSVEVKEI